MDLQRLVAAASTNVAALIGFAGVAVGALITFVANTLVAGHQAKLRVREKIVDKRIAAYEAVLRIAKDLRETTNAPEGLEATVDNRVSNVLPNIERGEEWRVEVAQVMGTHLHWLERDLRQELMFLQNYLLNITSVMSKQDPVQRARTALVAREDLVAFARRIEKIALRFFDKGAIRFRLRHSGIDQGLSTKELHKRLRKTAAFGGPNKVVNW